MFGDRIMKVSFLISLSGHLLFLGMPGFNLVLPHGFKKPEEVTVRIKIEKPPLLPKIDIMGEKKNIKEIIEKLKPPEREVLPQSEKEIVIEQPLEEPTEEDIEVIDPAKEAMLRYQDMVKQKIEEVRRYPSWAERQGIEGIVYLTFRILSDGLSQDVKIVRSSGSKILDEEAIATIKRANPFSSIPGEINPHFVQMEVSIVFTLNRL